VNFRDILEKWEKQTPENRVYNKDAAAYGAYNGGGFNGNKTAAERRTRLRRKKPDAFIDLHGLNVEEAWITLQAFFEDSRKKGLEKILVIHGKGNHWNEGILRDLSRRFIESCSYAGESGYCHARDGGTGATWVILKN
jgi:DNA-nicking Smr family endonuclease